MQKYFRWFLVQMKLNCKAFEINWSLKMPTFAIFTPSTYEVRIKSKKPQVPLLKNLSLNKNRLHVKNLEFKTRLLHIYTEIDSLFHVRKYSMYRQNCNLKCKWYISISQNSRQICLRCCFCKLLVENGTIGKLQETNLRWLLKESTF